MPTATSKIPIIILIDQTTSLIGREIEDSQPSN